MLKDQPEIIVDSDLTSKECPIRIVDHKEWIMRNKTISFVKMQWSNHDEMKATWELEDEIRRDYPFLFT